jgi:hypothetical protein
MFHKDEYAKLVNAGYMASDPKNRQEVFSDGDHVSGNSLEPGGWSLENDNGAYKPGREWTHKSFYFNPVYESAHLHQMMKKCHEDFPKAPSTTSYLAVVPHMTNSTWWKTYSKEWEKVVIYPQGSLIFTARADTTFDSANLTPAGSAGGPHRVFVSGCPWPVAVLYRDVHTVPEIDPVLLSHLRFGHADCRRIDTFFDKNIATGISLGKGETARCNPATNCAVCKLVKTPRPGRFPGRDPQRHQWLEVNAYLSSDICGPIAPTSTTGHRYLIVFVCRSSGYTHTYFLKKKSDAPDVLIEFLDDIKQSGHRPTNITIKSDAESVYIHGLFQQRCRELGIKSVFSPPHEHERNGSSEKTFRDIGDLAHTMMATSAFPTTGWTHAYRHATWLKNRLPTKRLDGDTPYFRMFGKDYDMSKVRIFGCRAFAHIPSALRTKLDPRCELPKVSTSATTMLHQRT